MKKIFTILLTAVASFVLVSVANAQSIDETILDPNTSLSLDKRKLKFPKQKSNYTIDNSDGKKVAYRKSISEPFSDGTYYIKLETFATGSATKTVDSTPSDIILVLDLSSSMNSQTYTYKGRSMSRLAALRLVIEDFAKTVYDNNADALSYDSNYARDRIAIIGYNRNASMISTNGWVYIDDATNGVQKNATTGAYSGGLITKIQEMNYDSGTRPDHGFQMAIEELLTNGQSKRANANLTVLLFTDGYPTDQAGSGLGDDGYDGSNGQTAQSVDHFDYPFASKALYYASQLKKQEYAATIWSVGLITSVARDVHSWQYRNYCRVLQMMDWISSNYPNAAFDASSITNLAIENGSYKGRTNSTVYTGNNVVRPWRNAWTYSETGDAITLDDFVPGQTTSDGDKFKSDGYCQIVDDNTDFSSIFEAIAKQTAGTANAALTSATSNVDVVSNSFILPDDVLEATDIKDKVRVFTAKLNSITGGTNDDKTDGTYNFETEILIPNSTDTYNLYNADGTLAGISDVDNAITVSLQGTHGIKVENFDYAANFCGPVYKPTSSSSSTRVVDHYTGHKIIILIPIQMNPDAVGGPNVETNAEGSGLYLPNSNKPLIEFDSPTVSLPVNVYIEKSGLEGRESAKFKIERAEMPDMTEWTEAQIAAWDPNTDKTLEWSYVSSVFVTNSPTTEKTPIVTGTDGKTTGGNPMVRVKGMPATLEKTVGGATVQVPLIYRISEEPWSWSYDPQTAPQFTVTTKIDNPFTFDNMKKDHIDVEVRHAESKVTNIFNSGTTKRFDDSKTNTGRESSGPAGLTTTTNP